MKPMRTEPSILPSHTQDANRLSLARLTRLFGILLVVCMGVFFAFRAPTEEPPTGATTAAPTTTPTEEPTAALTEAPNDERYGDSIIGEWHGDFWVPPFRPYTTREAQIITNGTSLLIIGDSLGRRLTAATAHFLLAEGGHESNSDVQEGQAFLNRGSHNHYAWKSVSPHLLVSRLDFVWAPLAHDTLNFTSAMDANSVDHSELLNSVFIVCIGTHDANHRDKSGDLTQQALAAANHVLQSLRYARDAGHTVIWRTQPRLTRRKSDEEKRNHFTEIMNSAIQEGLRQECGIFTLDFDSVIRDHDRGSLEELIDLAGDSENHFNNLGRQIEVQLLIRLLDRITHHNPLLLEHRF